MVGRFKGQSLAKENDGYKYLLNVIDLFSKTAVRNFPSAAVSAATFGERPRQAADGAHLLLLAGSQRRCSLDRAGALKVCLRSVEIFDWKD